MSSIGPKIAQVSTYPRTAEQNWISYSNFVLSGTWEGLKIRGASNKLVGIIPPPPPVDEGQNLWGDHPPLVPTALLIIKNNSNSKLMINKVPWHLNWTQKTFLSP